MQGEERSLITVPARPSRGVRTQALLLVVVVVVADGFTGHARVPMASSGTAVGRRGQLGGTSVAPRTALLSV